MRGCIETITQKLLVLPKVMWLCRPYCIAHDELYAHAKLSAKRGQPPTAAESRRSQWINVGIVGAARRRWQQAEKKRLYSPTTLNHLLHGLHVYNTMKSLRLCLELE
jgi:hypothetical protein